MWIPQTLGQRTSLVHQACYTLICLMVGLNMVIVIGYMIVPQKQIIPNLKDLYQKTKPTKQKTPKSYSQSVYMSLTSWLVTLLHVMTHTGPHDDGATTRGILVVAKEVEEEDAATTHAFTPPTSTRRRPTSHLLVSHCSDQVPQPYLRACHLTRCLEEREIPVFSIVFMTSTGIFQLQDHLRKKSWENKVWIKYPRENGGAIQQIAPISSSPPLHGVVSITNPAPLHGYLMGLTWSSSRWVLLVTAHEVGGTPVSSCSRHSSTHRLAPIPPSGQSIGQNLRLDNRK